MIWVESAGGPLAVMAEDSLADWSGYDGDYERACDVAFVGVVSTVTGGQVLVIGDEPAGTTFIADTRTFVQWLYGEEDADVPAQVAASDAGADWEPGPRFEVTGPLVLFDSACPGGDLVIEAARPDDRPSVYDGTDNGVRIDIAPGAYQVRSADVAPDERTCLRLHRLTPLG